MGVAGCPAAKLAHVTDCLFCGIASGRIPATIVHETDDVVAFRDLDPQAPTHVLVIPRAHYPTMGELAAADPVLAAAVLSAAAAVAADEGLGTGFRVVLNTGRDGGQSVGHVHAHLLGGRPMLWPPG